MLCVVSEAQEVYACGNIIYLSVSEFLLALSLTADLLQNQQCEDTENHHSLIYRHLLSRNHFCKVHPYIFPCALRLLCFFTFLCLWK